MSILSRVFGNAPALVERREPRLALKSSATTTDTFASAPWLYGAFGGFASSAGVPVSPWTTLQVAAAYACVKCLSEDIAKLPIVIRRRLPRGGSRIDHDHPLNLLFRRPNRWQTPFEFRAYWISSLALRGNGITAVLRDPAGNPRSLVPINPDRQTVELSTDGHLFYTVNHPLVGYAVTLHQDDIMHLRNPHAMVADGVMGLSPIMAAQEALGLAQATQQHGAILFRQGAQISGVLTTDQKLTPEAAQRIGQNWRDTYSGVQNMGKTAVLEQGLRFDKLSMTNEDAQFLATRVHQVVEVCRYWRVPPHKVFELTRSTFSNIENQGQDYINDALMPIGAQLEQRLEETLLFERERGQVSITLDFDAILRGDKKTRYDAANSALLAGWQSVNEVRQGEGLAPIEGGDVYRSPLNMAPVDTPKPADTTPATPDPDGDEPKEDAKP